MDADSLFAQLKRMTTEATIRMLENGDLK